MAPSIPKGEKLEKFSLLKTTEGLSNPWGEYGLFNQLLSIHVM